MKGKRAAVAATSLAVLGVFPAIWYFSRRPPLVEFTDGGEPLRFLYPDELHRKPLIDVTLGGLRLALPAPPINVIGPKFDLKGNAGYLQVGNEYGLTSSHFELDGRRTGYHTYAVDDPTAIRRKIISFIDVPYAIDPAERDVDLVIGVLKETRRKVRLPYTDRFGPSIRKSSQTTAGPWTLKATPRPWKLSDMPIWFDLQVAPADDRIFMLEADTLAGPNSFIQTYLFKKGELVQFLDSLQAPIPRIEGTLYELEAVPISIGARARPVPGKPGMMRYEYHIHDKVLRDSSGAQRPVEDLGFKAIECSGWTATHGIMNRPKLNPPVYFLFGGSWPATGYRVKNRWSIDLPLDIPQL